MVILLLGLLLVLVEWIKKSALARVAALALALLVLPLTQPVRMINLAWERRPPLRRMRLLIFVSLSFMVACDPPVMTRRAGPVGASLDVDSQLAALADSAAAAWNRGDLEGYLAPYADSAIVVVPSGPLSGRAQLREYLKPQRSWRGPTEQHAEVRNSRTRWLDHTHVIQTAEVVVRGGEQAERHSWATAVWARTPAGWRVIHEQSF